MCEKTEAVVCVAMCIRFWPGWTWLKQTIAENRYGPVLSARFTRLASHPAGPFRNRRHLDQLGREPERHASLHRPAED